MKLVWFHLKYITFLILVLISVHISSLSFLTQIHIAFRHGERSPTDTFPNDPYINYSWPGGWGQLTNRGKLQMYELGKLMRSEYGNFIPKIYWPKDVNVTSSYSDRCLMSAELFCAGLFPPEGPQIWNNDLLWQPLPIYYAPRDQDTTIVMKTPCTKYDKIFKETRVSPAIMEIENKYKDLKKYLTHHTGMLVKDIEDIESISNTLEIEMSQNFTLPSWVNKSMMATMKELGARNLALYSETEYMKRIKGGMFLKNVIDSMEKRINGVVTPILYLYAAHDLTLVHVLRTLNLIDLLKPEFGAVLIFELYSDGEIKMNYRNAWNAVPETQVIANCPTPCSINDFKKSLERVLPVNFNQECIQN